MNKKDWKEYINYVRGLIDIESKVKETTPRAMVIKNYNLSALFLDVNDAKRQYSIMK